MAGWSELFSGAGGMTGDAVSATAAKTELVPGWQDMEVGQGTAEPDNWVSRGLKAIMPQVLGVTSKRAGGGGATAQASAKPVSGNAGSAMEVPKMISKAASNNPLDDIQQWGNLF